MSEMTWRETFLGWLSGRIIVWLHKKAMKRGDFHEANHCMAAIVAGNSTHNLWPCNLPDTATMRPEVYTVHFNVGDPRE